MSSAEVTAEMRRVSDAFAPIIKDLGLKLE
jgi:hypothetical protein